MGMARWGWAVLWAAVFSSAVTGCGAAFAEGGEDDDISALKKRAAFDFDCPKSQIKTVTIDDRTKGVSGCDHRATYVQTCARHYESFDSDCTWVMNNSNKRRDEQE
jgi:hypothetical protein